MTEKVKFVPPVAGQPNPNLDQIDVLTAALDADYQGSHWGISHAIDEQRGKVKLVVSMTPETPADPLAPIPTKNDVSTLEYDLNSDIEVAVFLQAVRDDFMRLIDRR